MATTTQVKVNKKWVKVAGGDCTIQAIKSEGLFDIAVSTTQPTANACITISLGEPITFAYQTPVWCKSSASSSDRDQEINVIA